MIKLTRGMAICVAGVLLMGLLCCLGCHGSSDDANLPHDSSLTYKKPPAGGAAAPGAKGGVAAPPP